MHPKKTQALDFNHLLCTVIRLFIVICHDFFIPFFQIFVHVDIKSDTSGNVVFSMFVLISNF